MEGEGKGRGDNFSKVVVVLEIHFPFTAALESWKDGGEGPESSLVPHT